MGDPLDGSGVLMTLSTQVNAQARKEFVCNKWSQMGDVETITEPLLEASNPFVLFADGNRIVLNMSMHCSCGFWFVTNISVIVL
ncbi:hypothetical protein IMCC1933_18630 [Rhodobacteraceae bacterium IMCC1933]|nr:hypothetical protein [Rhodobacteraceae bacterium IMCC1923]MDP4068311.1 hypothetical protein [Rhodobacteraceae bacterium IMCC1933]MDP4071580.1 hypothetical protein [Rhodobacteraceae bacterium IMCC1909]